jgi:hypothetical protein
MFLEKLRCRFIRADEILPKKKIVHLIGINDLLKRSMIVTQPVRQIDCLAKGNIAIVVSLDEEDRQLPLTDRRVW